jgi:methyl-accepting chemotaxis protein
MSSIRNHVREWGPTWLYGVSIVVGSVTIWFGKLYEANILLVTTVPVALMLFYAAINAALPGLRVRNEQTGDNLYYMGFVFTLVSLGISLFKFTGDASIEDIVRNFGIAIISTVSGILLRIMFNQIRRDPADIERAVRTELSELTRKVRTELDSSALEFSSYRRTSNQMLSEGFEEIARQAERNGEAVRAAIEAMSLKATQTLQDTADRLVATLEQTHRQVSEIAEKNVTVAAKMSERLETAMTTLKGRAEGLGTAIEDVTAKYTAVRSPEEVLRIDVAPAIEALRAVVEDNMKIVSEHAAGTRDTTKKVLSALTPFKQTAVNLNQLSGRIDESNQTSDRSTQALSDVLAGIADAVSATKDATLGHAKATEEITKLIGKVLSEGSTATRLVNEQNRAYEERIERLLSVFPPVALNSEPNGPITLDVSGSELVSPNGGIHDAVDKIAQTEESTGGRPSHETDEADRKDERSRWNIFQR